MNIANRIGNRTPFSQIHNHKGLTDGGKVGKDVKSQAKTEEKSNTGDEEYYKCVVIALKEAIDVNEELRVKIKSLINENSDLRKEIDDKDSALIELAQHYEFCQKNHTVKEKRTKTRKSKSL